MKIKTKVDALTFLILLTFCSVIQANWENQWQFTKSGNFSYQTTSWQGKNCLRMDRTLFDGKKVDIAWLNSIDFNDGTIEFDMASPADKSYIGFVFRLQDEHNYECVYLRTHASGNIDAMQYMPVKDTVFDWWNYKDAKYKAVADVPAKKWFHVKAEIKGAELKVWVNGTMSPNMHYKNLRSANTTGKIGFLLGNSPSACFANLKVNDKPIWLPKAAGFGKLNLNNWQVDEPDSLIIEQKEYWGKQATYLKKIRTKDKDKIGDALYLKDFEFENGIIECDIAAEKFTGIAFRTQDGNRFECIYFRPFNSGTAKHDKTVQYSAKGSKYTWYYLRKNFPGKYEAGADIQKWQWFHVKLDIKGATVKVYVNNNPEPVLVVDDLKYGESKGSVGFWSWEGYFANLTVTKQ